MKTKEYEMNQVVIGGEGTLGTITSSTLRLFFFSSRRRHTRCGRDWSSDVCSSDLSMGLRLPALNMINMDRSITAIKNNFLIKPNPCLDIKNKDNVKPIVPK